MIIYFCLFIPLLFLSTESSSIRGRNHKNDLVPFLGSRLDISKKDPNSIKVVSKEPFILQLQMPKEMGAKGAKERDKKIKRPAKKRVSKIQQLRKKQRKRRDLLTLKAKSREEKLTPFEIPRAAKETENRLQNTTKNSVDRTEILKALSFQPKKPETKLERAKFSKNDEKTSAKHKKNLATNRNLHKHQDHRTKLPYPITPKLDRNLQKYTYKDLVADRERLEQKIKYIKNMLNVNDTNTDDAVRVRRRSDSDRAANKIAKMFLTLSAVNGLHEKRKSKCNEDDDEDRVEDVWEKERRTHPFRKSTSSNEERYKVKKWIEFMKNKRSSGKTCPCMKNSYSEDDAFPLEQKLPKGYFLMEKGRSSEESSESYGDPFYYSRDKLSKSDNVRKRLSKGQDQDSKLKAPAKNNKKKIELPFEDLELYRSRARQILQNAEEILDKIKEEEEKRLATPNILMSQLKELTTRIHGEPRNDENDLIRKIQKNLGWGPLAKAEDSKDGTFLDNVKSFILDPYEKAKALTDESTKKLSSYLLRNLGRLQESSEEEDVRNANDNANDSKLSIYFGGIPRTEEKPSSADLAREEPTDGLHKSKEDLQNWEDTLSAILSGGDETVNKDMDQVGHSKQQTEEIIQEKQKNMNDYKEHGSKETETPEYTKLTDVSQPGKADADETKSDSKDEVVEMKLDDKGTDKNNRDFDEAELKNVKDEKGVKSAEDVAKEGRVEMKLKEKAADKSGQGEFHPTIEKENKNVEDPAKEGMVEMKLKKTTDESSQGVTEFHPTSEKEEKEIKSAEDVAKEGMVEMKLKKTGDEGSQDVAEFQSTSETKEKEVKSAEDVAKEGIIEMKLNKKKTDKHNREPTTYNAKEPTNVKDEKDVKSAEDPAKEDIVEMKLSKKKTNKNNRDSDEAEATNVEDEKDVKNTEEPANEDMVEMKFNEKAADKNREDVTEFQPPSETDQKGIENAQDPAATLEETRDSDIVKEQKFRGKEEKLQGIKGKNKGTASRDMSEEEEFEKEIEDILKASTKKESDGKGSAEDEDEVKNEKDAEEGTVAEVLEKEHENKQFSTTKMSSSQEAEDVALEKARSGDSKTDETVGKKSDVSQSPTDEDSQNTPETETPTETEQILRKTMKGDDEESRIGSNEEPILEKQRQTDGEQSEEESTVRESKPENVRKDEDSKTEKESSEETVKETEGRDSLSDEIIQEESGAKTLPEHADLVKEAKPEYSEENPTEDKLESKHKSLEEDEEKAGQEETLKPDDEENKEAGNHGIVTLEGYFENLSSSSKEDSNEDLNTPLKASLENAENSDEPVNNLKSSFKGSDVGGSEGNNDEDLKNEEDINDETLKETLQAKSQDISNETSMPSDIADEDEKAKSTENDGTLLKESQPDAEVSENVTEEDDETPLKATAGYRNQELDLEDTTKTHGYKSSDREDSQEANLRTRLDNDEVSEKDDETVEGKSSLHDKENDEIQETYPESEKSAEDVESQRQNQETDEETVQVKGPVHDKENDEIQETYPESEKSAEDVKSQRESQKTDDETVQVKGPVHDKEIDEIDEIQETYPESEKSDEDVESQRDNQETDDEIIQVKSPVHDTENGEIQETDPNSQKSAEDVESQRESQETDDETVQVKSPIHDTENKDTNSQKSAEDVESRRENQETDEEEGSDTSVERVSGTQEIENQDKEKEVMTRMENQNPDGISEKDAGQTILEAKNLNTDDAQTNQDTPKAVSNQEKKNSKEKFDEKVLDEEKEREANEAEDKSSEETLKAVSGKQKQTSEQVDEDVIDRKDLLSKEDKSSETEGRKNLEESDEETLKAVNSNTESESQEETKKEKQESDVVLKEANAEESEEETVGLDNENPQFGQSFDEKTQLKKETADNQDTNYESLKSVSTEQDMDNLDENYEYVAAENPEKDEETPLRSASFEDDFYNKIDYETPFRSSQFVESNNEDVDESEETLREENMSQDLDNQIDEQNEDEAVLRSTHYDSGTPEGLNAGGYDTIMEENSKAAHPAENLRLDHQLPSSPLNFPKSSKLKVPESIRRVIKDLDGKEKSDIISMQNLNPDKIDHMIDKIGEQQNLLEGNEDDCMKECACAEEMNTKSRNIGRYEIVKDFLQWVKDLQLNRVLSDD